MKTVRSLAAVRSALDRVRRKGGSIGFVPTMGALHAGHASLVRRSARENACTVASVFVNPTQFGPREDFRRYPRTPLPDARLLRASGCDVLWRPAASQLYPEGERTRVTVPGLDAVLCGAFRPGHFTGVATVVAKLLAAVQPDRLYLGEKDGQQCVVVRRMVADLLCETRVVVCPTVRETDGLARSSRNAYLSAEERRAAPVLFRALARAARAVRSGERSAGRLRAILARELRTEPMFRIQYAEAVDAETLVRPRRVSGRVRLAVAGFLGRTRLIDNRVVRVPR